MECAADNSMHAIVFATESNRSVATRMLAAKRPVKRFVLATGWRYQDCAILSTIQFCDWILFDLHINQKSTAPAGQYSCVGCGLENFERWYWQRYTIQLARTNEVQHGFVIRPNIWRLVTSRLLARASMRQSGGWNCGCCWSRCWCRIRRLCCLLGGKNLLLHRF